MTGAGLGGISFLDALRGQVDHILDACTKCGKCVEACPMVEPAGLDPADGVVIADGVLDLLAGGGGTKAAERWAQVCTNSGKRIPACDYGINPRFLVNMARIASKAKLGANEVRRAANEYFNAMGRSTRTIARLQLAPEVLARVSPPLRAAEEYTSHPEIVFYTGCNVIKTPHIALLVLEVLDGLGVSDEVMGGTATCCGIQQFKRGDAKTAGRVSYNTIDRLSRPGAARVISWCPSCQIQIAEVALPAYRQSFGTVPFDMNPISQAVEGRRRQYIIASKFGNLRRADGTPTANGRPEYVKAACERSLQRLRTDVIDLYYIHRIDPTVPIEETVGAMSDLVRDGKVRFLGISEAGPQTIRRAHATHPMSAVQIEYSLWSREVETEVLDLCNEWGIGFVAYSPLGRGFLTGTITGRDELRDGDTRRRMSRFQSENSQHNLDLVAQLRMLAGAERFTPAQLALAWVLSRGRSIVPIAGTSHRPWLEENAAASAISVSTATLDALERIFRPGAAAGARYPHLFEKTRGI